MKSKVSAELVNSCVICWTSRVSNAGPQTDYRQSRLRGAPQSAKNSVAICTLNKATVNSTPFKSIIH